MGNMKLVSVHINFSDGRRPYVYEDNVRTEFLWATQSFLHVSARGYCQSHKIEEIKSIVITPMKVKED